MKITNSITNSNSQDVSDIHEHFEQCMTAVAFVKGTQTAYRRALKRFEQVLDRKTFEVATVTDAKRHLTSLKQEGVPKTRYSHASASLRFFFAYLSRVSRA